MHTLVGLKELNRNVEMYRYWSWEFGANEVMSGPKPGIPDYGMLGPVSI